jgi:hypothetical protein
LNTGFLVLGKVIGDEILLVNQTHTIDRIKAIDYPKEHVRVLPEQQERQNKRILLSNSQ